MSPITITAGLITYNAISTIERAINSILVQSWDNLDIVIVDDCSEDGTYEYLKHLADINSSVRVFRNSSNFGVAFSRNRVINEAKGEFIAYFDDDDESLPDRIKSQAGLILQYEKQNPQIRFVVCHTPRRVVYPNGREFFQKTMGSRVVSDLALAPHGLDVAREVLLGGFIKDSGACPTCCQMARKVLYQEIGGFDNQFRRLEDTDLVIRVSLAGGHFIGTPDALVVQHMTKTPDKSIKGEFFYTKMLLEKHKNFLSGCGQYENCVRWAGLRHEILGGNLALSCKTALIILITDPKFFFRKLTFSLKNLNININFKKFHAG